MFDPQQTEQKVSHCLLLICFLTHSKQIKNIFKGTIQGYLKWPSNQDDNVRFTTVNLKLLSDE